MHPEAERLVAALGLTPHPEGGYYRETWRSQVTVSLDGTEGAPLDFRPGGSTTQYLLAGEDGRCLRRLYHYEMFHLYAGGPLAIHVLGPGAGSRGYARRP